MLVIGAGTGAHKTVAVRLLARVYPARTGRALDVLDTVGALSGVVAPVAVVGSLSETAGFRAAFWLLAVTIIGATVLGCLAFRPGHRSWPLMATALNHIRRPDRRLNLGFTTVRVNTWDVICYHMARKGEREYVCVQCGRHETVDDALLSTCQQCGGEMRNVDLIRK